MLSNELFPLSTYYSVCKRGPSVLRATIRNGMRGHFSTTAEITQDGKLTVDVGKFSMVPGTTLEDVAPTSPGRRIQIMREGGYTSLLVTNFQKSSSNMVVIGYEQKDNESYRAALRLANNIVGCRLSEAP
jgi:hypothetical protein